MGYLKLANHFHILGAYTMAVTINNWEGPVRSWYTSILPSPAGPSLQKDRCSWKQQVVEFLSVPLLPNQITPVVSCLLCLHLYLQASKENPFSCTSGTSAWVAFSAVQGQWGKHPTVLGSPVTLGKGEISLPAQSLINTLPCLQHSSHRDHLKPPIGGIQMTHRWHTNDRLTRKHNKHTRWSTQRGNQKIKTKANKRITNAILVEDKNFLKHKHDLLDSCSKT